VRPADFTEGIVDKEKYVELVQEAAEVVLLELNQREDTLNERPRRESLNVWKEP
jgi:hypothetical protein